jgi:hypothetical protein
MADGDFQVGKRQRPISFGNEVFAVHAQQQIEHALIEDLPRPDLLFDHVEAGTLDIHLLHHQDQSRKIA